MEPTYEFEGYVQEPVYNEDNEYCYSQYTMNFKEENNGNK